MIGIVDYGAGNLFSVSNSLTYLGIEHRIVRKPEELGDVDGILLPGVGAFPDAMKLLNDSGFTDVLKEQSKRKPLLGICLGMQMLFEKSFEFGETEGLGLIPGVVRPLRAGDLKLPHMGWNDLQIVNPCAMTEGMPEETYVYFVHSFCAETEEENISCAAAYGERFPALVHKGNVYGAQYHPEKSGAAGLAMLKKFAALCERKEA